MTRGRTRTLAVLGFLTYLLVGLTTEDLPSLEIAPSHAGRCPTPLQRIEAPEAGGAVITVLQGNLWMLPDRPFLFPYTFSTDRAERLETFLRTVRDCRPSVILLQEVFDVSMVELLARHLPDYRVESSGRTDITGTVNASGLVTLTRLPVRERAFHAFAPLPDGAGAVESLARKGFLAVEVATPDFRGTVLNLHLYAYEDDGDASLTHAQLREVLAFVEEERARGRPVLVGGDFNIPRDDMEDLLPEGWSLSLHGPTYDPARNPYTVQGANNTAANHRDRREGLGTRTIDFLLTPPGTRARMRSTVLDTVLMSDHQFLHHTVVVTDE